MTFLPYYCPTFRTEHLLEPCKTNLARAKALKAAKKHIGPLERCVECKGKMLITNPRVEIEGLPAPESWVEKRFTEKTEKYVSPEQKGWEPNPEVTTTPLFLKDVGKKEPEMRQLSPEKIAKTRAVVQRMAERYKKPPKKEEIDLKLPKSPITEEDKYPKQEEPVPAVKLTEKEAVKLGIVPPEAPDPQGEIVDAALRWCPTHPEVLQRVDKLGRWMGMCDECLSIRGKECGKKNVERGVTAPPVSIPLNLPRYAELKAWLKDQADEHEQTLQGAIMYILKMAWRQGT